MSTALHSLASTSLHSHSLNPPSCPIIMMQKQTRNLYCVAHFCTSQPKHLSILLFALTTIPLQTYILTAHSILYCYYYSQQKKKNAFKKYCFHKISSFFSANAHLFFNEPHHFILSFIIHFQHPKCPQYVLHPYSCQNLSSILFMCAT